MPIYISIGSSLQWNPWHLSVKLFTNKHIESISSADICSYIGHIITVIYWHLLCHFTKWYIWIIVIPNRSIVKRSIFTLNWQTDNLTRTKKSINMNGLSALTALQISTTVKTYSCSLGQHVSALLLWMYYFLLPHSFESTAVVFLQSNAVWPLIQKTKTICDVSCTFLARYTL